jgi:hypothetical protein
MKIESGFITCPALLIIDQRGRPDSITSRAPVIAEVSYLSGDTYLKSKLIVASFVIEFDLPTNLAGAV